jgi:hypothetical protein
MHHRGEYIDKIAERVRELDVEIRDLEEIANRAVEEVKAKYHEQINDLFIRKEDLKEKVNRIRSASGNAWEDMKTGTELSWEAFEESVNSRIKKKS